MTTTTAPKTKTTGRVINRTALKIQELDVVINKKGISYDATSNRVSAVSPKGLRAYISSKKAGGDKEMFYAAVGIRNFMTAFNRKPNKEDMKIIIREAQSVEKMRKRWEARYMADKDTQHSSMRETPAPIQEGVSIEKEPAAEPRKRVVRAGRKKESLDTIIKKSVQKGIITSSSAAGKKLSGLSTAHLKIKELGLDLGHQYFTAYEKGGYSQVMIRITLINNKKLNLSVNSKHFAGDLAKTYQAASDLRAVMLRTGKLPSTKVRDSIYIANGSTELPTKSYDKKPSKGSVKEEITFTATTPRPQRNEDLAAGLEQEPKLSINGILARIKNWFFGK